MSQIATNERVNYEIWVADKCIKAYPDLPSYCWGVAQRLRRRYEAAGVIRSIRLCRVVRHLVPVDDFVRLRVKERRTLMFSVGQIYKDDRL